ncbi:MAG TPA: type II toxin-antitoxin system VapB family antitoxin [Bauldia sp.]|jgi:antitoxin VapB|nr:type II toxin-antitoxin system VapB family antitoxin [Bauldia sp.]
MGINIKNPETEQLIRELAAKTGKGQTEAVTIAVREALARLERRGLAERLMAIAEQTAPLFKPPYDTIEHGDLLYDKDTGLPR